MGWFKNESPYERKLRELEEEADRIRKNMRTIIRNVDVNGAQSSRRQAAPAWRNERPMPAPVPEAEVSDRAEDVSLIDDDTPVLDFDGADNRAPDIEESAGPQAAGLPPYGPARLRRQTGQKPEHLANYLASGSFGKKGSLSRERRIQRNKAIFMLVFALLAIFSLISWFR